MPNPIEVPAAVIPDTKEPVVDPIVVPDTPADPIKIPDTPTVPDSQPVVIPTINPNDP